MYTISFDVRILNIVIMNEFSSAKIQTTEQAAKLGTLPPIRPIRKPIQIDQSQNLPDRDPISQNKPGSPNYVLPPGFEQAGKPRVYTYGQPQAQPAWVAQQPIVSATEPQLTSSQASTANMLVHTRQQHYVAENGPQPQLTGNPAVFGAEDPTLSRKLSDSTRIGFIRKVYAILSVQLAITAIFTIAALKSMALQEFMVKNTALFFVTMLVYFVSIYALACYPKVARSVPINYILTFIFTAAMSYLVGFICSRSDPNLVATAAILTAVMMLELLDPIGLIVQISIQKLTFLCKTTYACYTKTDFTMCGGFLFVMSFLLIAMIFVGIWVSNKFYHAVVSVISIGLFSLYIIYDTQLIVGNKESKYMLDDYIMAAINLYLDIINLFLSILRLLGAASKSS